jgi:uncharacterized membrane protein
MQESSTVLETPVVRKINQLILWMGRHWLPLFLLSWGVFVGLPWLAPLLMNWGWTTGGELLYMAYMPFCHQLPQRSFFLFGSDWMYSIGEIQAAWKVTDNPMVMRQFVGNEAMGWKVAWSDRMVSMYTAILFWGLAYWPLRRRLRPLPLWLFGLLLLPMGIDGLTHLASDFAGMGQGFRDSNAWLATLTGHAFATDFYSGDQIGSFNSWMRLLSGFLFGLGVVWLIFPHLDRDLGGEGGL